MTIQQIIASDPKTSVWVAASAGTGKTKILTDRVLRLLLSGNEPSKILCLTFTKAAAAEMSIRINNELSEWVTFDENKLIKRLTSLTGEIPNKKIINFARRLFVKVLDAPENLKIQTIHSFCQFLIKKFPLEADINPNFKVIDDQTSKLLIKEAKLTLFNKISNFAEDFNEIRESIKYIAWNLHEDGFDKLIEEIVLKGDDIIKMFNFHVDIESILKTLCKKLNIAKNFDEKLLYKEFCKEHKHFENLKIVAQKLTNSTSKTDIEKGQNILIWLNLTEEDRVINILKYQSIFLTREKEALKKILTKKLADNEPEIYRYLKHEQERILEFIEQEKSLKLYIQSMHIIRFSEELLKEYKNLKARHSYLDYNDLISISYKLLQNNNLNDWILYKLDGGIDHILVDEAQDTSKEQWQIIENLTREFFSGIGARNKTRTLFVVGDEKQSIFSFQGANPKTFNDMHNYFVDKTSHIENFFKSVKLDTSFRSSRAVLELVDKIFQDKNLLSSIQSDDTELKHIAYRNLDAGKISIWPLVNIDNDLEDQIWPLPINNQTKSNPSQKLAELIAMKINEWLKSKKILKSKNRPIIAGDILILVRRRNEFIDFLIKELKKRNISVAGTDRLIITEHIAIMDLLAIGKFLLLPYDDLNLACVLKSPLINMNEEELFDISYNRRNSLWQSLKDKIDEKEIYKTSHNYLDHLLQKLDSSTVFNLYTEIIETTYGRRKFHARLGDEINDLLDEFLNLILKYESNHVSSLQGFLKWVESSNIEIKRDLEQSKNQIRIMTIHGAKGLQAPIVFLPDTNFVASNFDNLFYCNQNNLLYWPGSIKNYNNISYELREKNLIQEKDEFNRLLYVALTRAEDEIIICGYKNRNLNKNDCWYNIIKNSIEDTAISLPFEVNENFENFLLTKEEFVLEYEQQRKVNYIETIPNIFEDIKVLPEFIMKPIENIFQTKLFTPSNVDYKEKNLILNDNSCRKGIIIHKLLEYLPSVKIEKRREAALTYLYKYEEVMNSYQINEIVESCFNLLLKDQFKDLWSANSRAEVEISGMIGNKYMVSGQVDRLIINDDKVVLIDYKTTNNPPKIVEDVPEAYIKQMSMYKLLLNEVYPNKNIDCLLIWTSIPEVMKLPNEALENIQLQ